MDLDFSDEQKALGAQTRRFLTERCSSAAVRKILEGPESYDRDLYRGLADLGLLGAAIPEAYGGAGMTYLELCVLAEELGRAVAPVPVASSIYLAAEFLLEAGSEEQKLRWLPGLADGSLIGTFAYVEGQGAMRPERIVATLSAGGLSGRKSIVADGDVADIAIVAARAESGAVSLCIAELSAAGVTRRRRETLDATRGHAELIFDDVPVDLIECDDAAALIARVLDKAAVLVAFEQIGGADRALEMARDYALSRIAFGRPIGSFQAIKHMLADMFVANTLARSNCYYAAGALTTDAPDLPTAAATARISATRAFERCAKNNIHVHGGMGVTWEFDCHLYYRRANALALGLGPLSIWEERLIDAMRASRAEAAQ